MKAANLADRRQPTTKDYSAAKYAMAEDISSEMTWPADNDFSDWLTVAASAAHYQSCIQFDKTGQLFVFDFGPNERRLFVNAVMQFGLPPPEIIPPYEWLPLELLNKSPINIFSYTALFMRHIYEPEALDEAIHTWSDGLPKEFVNGAAVLSRIAMMALIRKKVVQYERAMGFTSYTHNTDDDMLVGDDRFDIFEGGLTPVHARWAAEANHARRTLANLENACSNSEQLHTRSDTKDKQNTSFLLPWHALHDYWLLAGITIHGYAAWESILTDNRFALLSACLKRSTSITFCGATLDETETKREHCAFLTMRLRLLEQALLVEEALWRIAYFALPHNYVHSHRSPTDTSAASDAINNNARNNQINSVAYQVARVNQVAQELASRLRRVGPAKKMTLPRDPLARKATIAAIAELQDLLDDLFADQPMLIASITCVDAHSPEVDKGIDTILLNESTNTRKRSNSASVQTHDPLSVSNKSSLEFDKTSSFVDKRKQQQLRLNGLGLESDIDKYCVAQENDRALNLDELSCNENVLVPTTARRHRQKWSTPVTTKNPKQMSRLATSSSLSLNELCDNLPLTPCFRGNCHDSVDEHLSHLKKPAHFNHDIESAPNENIKCCKLYSSMKSENINLSNVDFEEENETNLQFNNTQ